MMLIPLTYTYCQTLDYADIKNLSPTDTLFRIPDNEHYEMGDSCGYVNQKGDTIHALGKYNMCFTEVITTYGIVVDASKPSWGLIGIDQQGNRLFDVYVFDNGPDWLSDGLFRIKRNGKIGYANSKGQIIIDPQFECASQFSNGKAKVAYTCTLINGPNDEHHSMESDSWFYIDKKGKRIE